MRLYFVVWEERKNAENSLAAILKRLWAISYNSELSQNFLNCCADAEKSELRPRNFYIILFLWSIWEPQETVYVTQFSIWFSTS